MPFGVTFLHTVKIAFLKLLFKHLVVIFWQGIRSISVSYKRTTEESKLFAVYLTFKNTNADIVHITEPDQASDVIYFLLLFI